MRFLLLDVDGETLLATLGPSSEAAAPAHAGVGQTVVAIAPATDHRGHSADGTLKYSTTNGLVLIADDTPAAGFADFEFAEVAGP